MEEEGREEEGGGWRRKEEGEEERGGWRRRKRGGRRRMEEEGRGRREEEGERREENTNINTRSSKIDAFFQVPFLNHLRMDLKLIWSQKNTQNPQYPDQKSPNPFPKSK